MKNVARKCWRILRDWTLSKKQVRGKVIFLMKNLPAHTTVVCAVPVGPSHCLFYLKRYLFLPWSFGGPYPKIEL